MHQVLREGKLSRAATRMGSTVEASGAFYVGTFYTFYQIWKDGFKTMRESGAAPPSCGGDKKG